MPRRRRQEEKGEEEIISMSFTNEKQNVEEQEHSPEGIEEKDENSIARQILRFITLSLSLGLAVYAVVRLLKKLSDQRNRLGGDPTTDAPPPDKKKKGKGK
jgi:hypothetical protein